MRYLLAASILLALSACAPEGSHSNNSDQSPGTGRVTCADVHNDDQTSACDSGASALTRAAVVQDGVEVFDGGTVQVSSVVRTETSIEIVGGPLNFLEVYAWDAACGPVYEGNTYSVINLAERTFDIGTYSRASGSNCGEASPGPHVAYLYFYAPSADITRTWEPCGELTCIRSNWAPDKFTDDLLFGAQIEFTTQ